MRLADIKKYLNTLLASFSSVLDLELTILQADPLERIAATGSWYATDVVCYENGRLVPAWQNSYTVQVIETGKPVIAIDTKAYVYSHPKMYKTVDGQNYSVLAYPIYLREHLEGVLVIASFDEVQHEIIVEKQKQLMVYLEKIAGLITSKLEQESLLEETNIINNQMNSVIEAMDDGILLYSPEEGIKQCNMYAEKYLHFNDPILKQALLSRVIQLAKITDEEKPIRIQEISEEIDGFQYLLQVKTKFIRNSNGSVLCVINPFSQIQNSITQNEEMGTGVAGNLVFSGEKMRKLVSQAKIAAQHTSNVLITGESGTGKEMFARLIHTSSPRSSKPFVAVNCAAIPESLMESELFGYEEGAFTGARKGGKIGKIQLANHGTFFLDEIGDMSFALQAKLLRTIQESEIMRVGGTQPIHLDVRIISATSRDIEEMVSAGRFLDALYYRLNVVELQIPPLRERREDIIPLAEFYLQHFCETYKLEREFSPDVRTCFLQYDWPGNVRELRNTVENLVVSAISTVISWEDLPTRIARLGRTVPTRTDMPGGISMKAAVEALQREMIQAAVAREGSLRKAAAALEMDATTLCRLAKKLGVEP